MWEFIDQKPSAQPNLDIMYCAWSEYPREHKAVANAYAHDNWKGFP